MTSVGTSEMADELRRLLPPGSTVYATVTHVSRSGLYRHVSLSVVTSDRRIVNISQYAARFLGERLHNNGVGVSGCGMNMCSYLVMTLAGALYPDGFRCIGRRKKCPSNDHFNGDRNYRPHRHQAADYALRTG